MEFGARVVLARMKSGSILTDSIIINNLDCPAAMFLTYTPDQMVLFGLVVPVAWLYIDPIVIHPMLKSSPLMVNHTDYYHQIILPAIQL